MGAITSGGRAGACFWWLALIALVTFVLDPLGRAIALFGGCLFVLLTHLGASPYNNRRHNRVETIFLSDLVLITVLTSCRQPRSTWAHRLMTTPSRYSVTPNQCCSCCLWLIALWWCPSCWEILWHVPPPLIAERVQGAMCHLTTTCTPVMKMEGQPPRLPE